MCVYLERLKPVLTNPRADCCFHRESRLRVFLKPVLKEIRVHFQRYAVVAVSVMM